MEALGEVVSVFDWHDNAIIGKRAETVTHEGFHLCVWRKSPPAPGWTWLVQRVGFCESGDAPDEESAKHFAEYICKKTRQ